MENKSKTIIITNKVTHTKKTPFKERNEKVSKKRVVSEKWTFPKECYEHDYQLECCKQIHCTSNANLNSCSNTNSNTNFLSIIKTLTQEIHRKIYGYKQQDILKHKLDLDKFITFADIINKLCETQLHCYYCKHPLYVLYDIAREAKQWTVDRINNALGHNCDNYYICCLECNLKRRCTRDDKFLFTKQLKIIKKD